MNPGACRFPSKLEGLVVVCLGTLINKILIYIFTLMSKQINRCRWHQWSFIRIYVGLNESWRFISTITKNYRYQVLVKITFIARAIMDVSLPSPRRWHFSPTNIVVDCSKKLDSILETHNWKTSTQLWTVTKALYLVSINEWSCWRANNNLPSKSFVSIRYWKKSVTYFFIWHFGTGEEVRRMFLQISRPN